MAKTQKVEDVVEVDDFDVLAVQIQEAFKKAVAWSGGHLFTTNANEISPSIVLADGTSHQNLAAAYLRGFADLTDRQYHNCSCCKHFLNHYGGLVAINATGDRRSALFDFLDPDSVPSHFLESVNSMMRVLNKAKITGVHLSEHSYWGQRSKTNPNDKWTHFQVQNPNPFMRLPKFSAGQMMAVRRQEFGMLLRGLSEFSMATFEKAVAMLQADTFYRGDKFAGAAQTLLALKQAIEGMKQSDRDPLLWRAVATLPAGYCHVKSSMIGTLLEDLESGMDDTSVKKRFDDKMQPHKYKQSTAAPKAGAIAQAEKLFAGLGLAPAVPRRLATLAEVASRAVWQPSGQGVGLVAQARATAPQAAPKLFAGLSAALTGAAPAAATGKAPSAAKSITWVKFRETVLRAAEAVTFWPVAGQNYSLGALTTAVDPDAPPLIKWDSPDSRNPFSWYRWSKIEPEEFGLPMGVPLTVLAAVPLPSGWNAEHAHSLDGVILPLQDVHDAHLADVGLALYAEALRDEVQTVRKVIQQHSLQDVLADPGAPLACGLVLRKSDALRVRLIATIRGVASEFYIDRWE
jgi:hypothetical protein